MFRLAKKTSHLHLEEDHDQQEHDSDDTYRAPLALFESISNVIIHPAQFQAIWGGQATSNERALAVAVLEIALSDLRRYRHAKQRAGQRLYMEAYQWVASDDREWPYSFVNLCDALKLSPDGLRERMLDEERFPAVAQAA